MPGQYEPNATNDINVIALSALTFNYINQLYALSIIYYDAIFNFRCERVMVTFDPLLFHSLFKGNGPQA